MAENTAEQKAQAEADAKAKAQAKAEADAQQQREREAAARARSADEPPTFHVDRLTSDDAYGLTGHPAHVIAGALELAGGNKKNFTLEEVGALVDEFLQREVPVEGEEQ